MACNLGLKSLFSTNHLRPAPPRSFRTLCSDNAFNRYGDDDVYDRLRRFVVYTPAFSSVTQGPNSSPDWHVDYEDMFPEPPSYTSASYGEYEDHKLFGWDCAFTKENLSLQFAMAGVGKEDVKVRINKNSLIVEGKEAEYKARVVLLEGVLKFDEVKAEMKNGMLTVMIPKLKDEENADVFDVKVE